MLLKALAQDCEVADLSGRTKVAETEFDWVSGVCLTGDRVIKITEQELAGTKQSMLALALSRGVPKMSILSGDRAVPPTCHPGKIELTDVVIFSKRDWAVMVIRLR